MRSSNIISICKNWRKQLHQFPELSGKEFQTAQRIESFLRGLQPKHLITKVGGTGILATFSNGLAGNSLLFRAELDALPIQEINAFEHRSQHAGIAHKCGHDGHMSILLGLAHYLSEDQHFQGEVHLLFQPAEETGAGALAVLADERFLNYSFDYAFALHNLPGFPLGQVLYKKDSITASVKSLILKLEGKTAHAAEPEHGINPAAAIAKIIQLLPQLSIPTPQHPDFSLLTPVHLLMGEKAYGVSAGYGELHLTLRSWTENRMKKISTTLLEQANQIAQEENLQFQWEWTDCFQANTNDAQAVAILLQSLEQLPYEVQEMIIPLKWGEDFGAFSQRYQGVFFGLGAGIHCPALHNPDYDFPDELLEIGIHIFEKIIEIANK